MTRSDRFLFTLSDFGVVTSYIVSFKEEGISAKNKVMLFMNKFVVITILFNFFIHVLPFYFTDNIVPITVCGARNDKLRCTLNVFSEYGEFSV